MLIEKEKLLRDISVVPNFGKEYDKALCSAIIDSQPVIDAVPVVRCKDCLFGIVRKYGIDCPQMEFPCPGDWFCANGERKRKEDTHET